MTRRDRYGEPVEDDDLVEPYGRAAFRAALARMRADTATRSTTTSSRASTEENTMTVPADLPADPTSRARLAQRVDRWWRDLPLTERMRLCVDYTAEAYLANDAAGRPPVV